MTPTTTRSTAVTQARRLVVAALLLAAPAAWAGELTLMTVDAHRSPGVTEPAAEQVERQLASKGYGHFTVAQKRRVDLATGERAGVRISDGHVLRVTLLEETGRNSQVKFRLLRDGDVQVESTVTVRPGRPLLVRAGKSADADLFAVVTVD